MPPESWKHLSTPIERRYAEARSQRMPPVQYINTVFSRKLWSSIILSATVGNSVKCRVGQRVAPSKRPISLSYLSNPKISVNTAKNGRKKRDRRRSSEEWAYMLRQSRRKRSSSLPLLPSGGSLGCRCCCAACSSSIRWNSAGSRCCPQSRQLISAGERPRAMISVQHFMKRFGKAPASPAELLKSIPPNIWPQTACRSIAIV